MKNKKNIVRIVATTFAVALGLTSAYACGPKEDIVRDEKTINIRACIGGYEDSWLKALAKQFNETYAEKGYKANVLASDPNLTSQRAIEQLYSKDEWVDLYFVNVNNTMASFTESRGEYGQLVADITDEVWNKPAINFRGEEESEVLISQKAAVQLPEDVLEVDGRVYGFNTSNDIGGMIVNTSKLAKYGITEIPKTTKEFFDVFELIYLGDESQGIKGSLESRIYPVTYLGGDNGYPIHFVTTWQAQYAGIEEYNQFYGYTDAEGNDRTEDGWKVYESQSLDKMMEAMYKMYDSSFVAIGSANNTISTAHSKIMVDGGGAVFMADGNWAYNEIITSYPDQIENLAFANIPVLSAVGVKLFSKYDFNEAECEEILSWTIDQADEGKTAEEIIALIKESKDWLQGVDEAQFKLDVIEVMKARGIYCSRSALAAGAFVAEKSTAKDVCYLFLRMFASNDNAILYNQECNGFTAYMTDFSQAKNTKYNQQCQAIVENAYATPVWMNSTDLRLKVGHFNKIFPNTDLSFVTAIIDKRVTVYAQGKKVGDDSIYQSSATDMLKVVRDFVKENWND